MADRQTNMKIAGLVNRRQQFQDQINTRKEDITELQEQIDKFEEQVQVIDQNIARMKVRAEKEVEDEQPLDAPVEESDAATTTGSLDASSQSSGGDYGGWRHYSKVGEVQRRAKPECDTKKKKKCKKKNVYDFMDHVWDSDGDS